MLYYVGRMTENFEKKVEKFIEENKLIKQGDRIVVGVSGGADSLALFFFLLALKPKMGLELFCVHVNHGLRKEAKEEAGYVEELCQRNEVRFYLKEADVLSLSREWGLGTEETGRRIRYDFFEEVLEKENADLISVAHNMNDLSETMLFNLSRGTGVRGLASIPPKRGNIIRPLLCVSRSEIEAYLKDLQIKYCTDASNFSDEYTRNRIRNKVLPIITKEISEKAVDHMAETAGQLREITAYFDKETEKAYHTVRKDVKPERVIYKKDIFLQYDRLLQKLLVKRAIDELVPGNRDITHLHLESVCDLLDCKGSKKVNLPYHMEVTVSYEEIVFEIKKEKVSKKEELVLPLNGTVKIHDLTVSCEVSDSPEGFDYGQKQYTKCFDYDKINESLVLRTRRTGDEIVVTKAGGKKKLKDYMIDEKIPAGIRDDIFLVSDGNNILWVIGYRMSEAAKITANTKRIVKITVFKEEYKNGS